MIMRSWISEKYSKLTNPQKGGLWRFYRLKIKWCWLWILQSRLHWDL